VPLNTLEHNFTKKALQTDQGIKTAGNFNNNNNNNRNTINNTIHNHKT